MNYVIYIDTDGQLRAFGSGNPGEFEALHETLEANQIIHINGAAYPENIPEEMKDTAPIFIKSITRQWLASVTFLAPKPQKEEKVEAPVAAPKPKAKKKATRKKKAE